MDYIHSVPEDIKCIPSTKGLGEVIFESLQTHGDKIAQVDATTGKLITFDQVYQKSISIAKEINARGISAGDIISVCVHDSLEGYFPLVASLFLGIKSSCLDPTLSEHHMIRLLAAVKPRIIFTDVDCVEKIESSLYTTGLKTEIVVFGETKTHTPISRFFMERESENHFQPKFTKDIYETALINFTSGTSGLPRAVCLSHYALLYRTMSDIFSCSAKVNLHYGNTWWIAGISAFLKCIISGSKNVIVPNTDMKSIFQHVQHYKIESIITDSSLLKSITDEAELSKYDISSLKTLYLAGATLYDDNIKLIRKNLPSVIVSNFYGMTELAGKSFMFQNINDKKFIDRKGVSCGQPIPGISYKVIDIETGKLVGANKIGELRMKSKLLMNGYHNLYDDTEKIYDEDGFLQTGDLFYYDEDSCFYFVERLQDLIRYQTSNISSVLEKFIITHPDIREAAVVHVSNDKGHQPMVVITLKEGSKVTEKALMDFINNGVQDRDLLKGGIKVVSHIPKTRTGIFLRKELRSLA